jgi:hypothetical protein
VQYQRVKLDVGGDGAAAPIVASGASGSIPINDGTNSITVDDGAGSLTVDGTVLANQGTTPWTVAGDVASGSSDSGNPIKIGSEARSSLPTALTNAQRADAISDLFGRLLVSHVDPAMQIWKEIEATSAATGTAIWTPASGKKIAITSLIITTGGTTAGVVTVWFGASGDTVYSQGADQVVFRGEFAPSTTSKPGAVVTPGFSPYFAATADHVLRLTTSAALTIYVTAYGYEF